MASSRACGRRRSPGSMNFGVAKSISVSAPDALSFAICDETSASVYSYACSRRSCGPFPAIARVSPRRHVLAELGVLVEDRDARLAAFARRCAAVDGTLAAVALEEADRPRVAREAAPIACEPSPRTAGAPCCAFRYVADREVVGGPDRVEDGDDLVLLDELPRELHRLRRVVGVVVVAVLELAPVDAALRVHVVEVGLGAGATDPNAAASPESGTVPPIRMLDGVTPGRQSSSPRRSRRERPARRGRGRRASFRDTGFAGRAASTSPRRR